jgi:riboflavin synthase
MFTGIVQATLPVKLMDQQEDMLSYAIAFPEQFRTGLKVGASVSVSGICQTVKKIEAESGLVYFDAIAETLNLTTLKYLKIGQKINIERSLKFGDEIGGHVLSGHIVDTVKIKNINHTGNHLSMMFECSAKWIKYIVHKGYVALDGCSLTIVDPKICPEDKTKAFFTICFIPETLRLSTFGIKKVADWVNLEIDSQTQTIVNTIENYLLHLQI